MLPFAAGLAALATAIGVGSVLAARGAANDELTARSVRADKLSRDTIDQTRRQLSGDALLLGRLLVSGSERPTALENRIVRFSVERDLSHVSHRGRARQDGRRRRARPVDEPRPHQAPAPPRGTDRRPRSPRPASRTAASR